MTSTQRGHGLSHGGPGLDSRRAGSRFKLFFGQGGSRGDVAGDGEAEVKMVCDGFVGDCHDGLFLPSSIVFDPFFARTAPILGNERHIEYSLGHDFDRTKRTQ